MIETGRRLIYKYILLLKKQLCDTIIVFLTYLHLLT